MLAVLDERPLPLLPPAARLLTLRITGDELMRLDGRHLALGLGCTWVVGMGRWWDDPGASLLQHLGLGSVAYVLALALLLWVMIRPIAGPAWGYRRVLTFVALTAPPAILYAIPVERFTSLDTASDLNVGFLAVVATWRVAMLVVVARRLGGLSALALLVCTLLPLTLIVAALAALNLERAVFQIMGGLRGGTANDQAYLVVLGMTVLSVYAFVPLLIAWITLVVRRALRERAARGG